MREDMSWDMILHSQTKGVELWVIFNSKLKHPIHPHTMLYPWMAGHAPQITWDKHPTHLVWLWGKERLPNCLSPTTTTILNMGKDSTPNISTLLLQLSLLEVGEENMKSCHQIFHLPQTRKRLTGRAVVSSRRPRMCRSQERGMLSHL